MLPLYRPISLLAQTSASHQFLASMEGFMLMMMHAWLVYECKGGSTEAEGRVGGGDAQCCAQYSLCKQHHGINMIALALPCVCLKASPLLIVHAWALTWASCMTTQEPLTQVPPILPP